MDYREVADGRLTSKTVEFEKYVASRRFPGDRRAEKIEHPLHGRRVKMSLVNGELAITGAHGITADLVKRIGLNLGEEYAITYPSRPVKVGDTWQIEGDTYARIIGDPNLIAGFAFMRLKEVLEIDGRKCAIIDCDEQF